MPWPLSDKTFPLLREALLESEDQRSVYFDGGTADFRAEDSTLGRAEPEASCWY